METCGQIPHWFWLLTTDNFKVLFNLIFLAHCFESDGSLTRHAPFSIDKKHLSRAIEFAGSTRAVAMV